MLLCAPSSLQERAWLQSQLTVFFASIKITGCVVMSDGWTDMSGRPLLNFLLAAPAGVYFDSALDTSGNSKTGRYLADTLVAVIERAGADNVVAVITDNAAAWSRMLVRMPWLLHGRIVPRMRRRI